MMRARREIMRDVDMMALALSAPPSLPPSPLHHVVISLVSMFCNPFKFEFPTFPMLSLRLTCSLFLITLSCSVILALLTMLFYYYFIGFYYSACRLFNMHF